MDPREGKGQDSSHQDVMEAGLFGGIAVAALYVILYFFVEEGRASNIVFLFCSPIFLIIYYRKLLSRMWFIVTMAAIFAIHVIIGYRMPDFGNGLTSHSYKAIALVDFPFVFFIIYFLGSKVFGEKLD